MSLAAHIKHNRRQGSGTNILRQLGLRSLDQFVGPDDLYGKSIGELGDHFSIGVDPRVYGIDHPVAPNMSLETTDNDQYTGRTSQDDGDDPYEFDSGDAETMFSLDTDRDARIAMILGHTLDATDNRTWELRLKLTTVVNGNNPSKDSFWAMIDFRRPEYQSMNASDQLELIESLIATVKTGFIGVVPYIDKYGHEGFDLCPLSQPISQPIDRAHNSACGAHA